MSVSLISVVEAFEYLYENLLDRRFAKSAGFEHYNERDLLPLVRAYLLGYFDDVEAELAATLPGSVTKCGRIDFRIDDIAVELAVRPRTAKAKCRMTAANNHTEVKKLLCWPRRALLILFDFGAPALTEADLNTYRELPSMGKGNWKRSAFHVAYFWRGGRPRAVQKRVLRIGRVIASSG